MVLRPATPADLDPLIALAQRPDVARTLAWDAADGLVAALAADAGELLVIEDAGALAGAVRWTVTNRRSRIVEIRSLMLDPAFHGRGLAAATVLELVERLFGRHGMHRIEAEVMGINDSARRVFERAGFVHEGTRRRAYDRHGAWQDGIRYGLLPEDR